MISSSEFARTARETLDRHLVPYRRGGCTLRGMDSAGFITYCLAQHGITARYSGTNDLFRTGTTRPIIPLKEALSRGLVVPGVILLHIANDNQEPDWYKHDGKGNCDYSLIAVSRDTAIYPSQIKGKLIETPINLGKGRANAVLFSRHVYYDALDGQPSADSSSNSSSKPSTPNSCAHTTTTLRMRCEPSKSSAVIAAIPKGALVTLLEYRGEWAYVRYRVSKTLFHTGWCARQYLSLD